MIVYQGVIDDYVCVVAAEHKIAMRSILGISEWQGRKWRPCEDVTVMDLALEKPGQVFALSRGRMIEMRRLPLLSGFEWKMPI